MESKPVEINNPCEKTVESIVGNVSKISTYENFQITNTKTVW